MSDVDNILAHYGIKGMRWGVRRDNSSRPPLTGLGPDKIERTTKNGEKITLSKSPPSILNKAVARMSSKYRDQYNEAAFLNIQDKTGKNVGAAQVWKKGNDELYLNWISVKSSARGQGYATAALKAAEDFGSKAGFKKMTLEVPGNAPDARHIYERIGFKVTKEDIDPFDPVWGGLTTMEYKFNKKAKHSDLTHTSSQNLEEEYGSLMDAIVKNLDEETEKTIKHYGVLGMRWGVRRNTNGVSTGRRGKTPSSADFKKAEAAKSKITKGRGSSRTKALSNDELQSLVKRMNLEKQYAELSSRNKRKVVGAKFVGDVMGNVAKGQASRLGNQLAQEQLDKLLANAGVKKKK